VQAELERIQLYVAVVKSSPLALNDPNRRHFFYTHCYVGTADTLHVMLSLFTWADFSVTNPG
jgi:hypothetical protein